MNQTVGMVRKEVKGEDIVDFLKIHWHENAVMESLDDEPNQKLINFEARGKDYDIFIHQDSEEYKDVTNFTEAQTIIIVDSADYTDEIVSSIVQFFGGWFLVKDEEAENEDKTKVVMFAFPQPAKKEAENEVR